MNAKKEMILLWQKLHSEMKALIKKYTDQDFTGELQDQLVREIRAHLRKYECRLCRLLRIQSTSEIEVQVENDFGNHWLVKVGLNDLRSKVFGFSQN